MSLRGVLDYLLKPRARPEPQHYRRTPAQERKSTRLRNVTEEIEGRRDKAIADHSDATMRALATNARAVSQEQRIRLTLGGLMRELSERDAERD